MLNRLVTPTKTSSSEQVSLGVLIALGVIARICAIWAFSDDLGRDRDAYLALAEGLLRSGSLADPQTGLPTAFRPPLYPVLLAPFIACLGRRAAVATLNLLAGSLSIGLAWWLGRFQFGDRASKGRISPTPATWCAALVALDPLLLRYSSQPMTEVLAAALFLATLTAAAHALSGEERCRIRVWAFVAGLLAGMCALCRPVFWAVWGLAGALAILWFAVTRRPAPRFRVAAPETTAQDVERPQRGALGGSPLAPAGRVVCERPAPVTRLTFIFAGFAVAVAPWVVRNALHFGTPILTTTHGGYTLYLANNPWFYRKVVQGRWSAVLSEDDVAALQRHAEAVIRSRLPQAGGELARDRTHYELAWQQIRRSPRLFLKACLVRMLRFWNVVPLAPPNRGRTGRLSVAAVGAFYSVELAAALWGFVDVVVALWLLAVAARRLPAGDMQRDETGIVRRTGGPMRLPERVRTAMRLFGGLEKPAEIDLGGATGSGPRQRTERLLQTRVLLWLVAVAAVLAFTLVHAVYWSNARMRAPLVPVVALLAIVPAICHRPGGRPGS